MNRSEFYHQHLSRVSRSFAYCIQQMSSPQREWIGLAYILCRLIDTVEDSPWQDPRDQEKAFTDFTTFIQYCPNLNQVKQWSETFPKDIPSGEARLLQDALQFFTDLHELDEQVRRPIQGRVWDMTRGMLYFSQNFRSGDGKTLSLTTVTETNQYCFFVAGVVGELLTQIMVPPSHVTQELLMDAYHFGFYLQKINLLKDYLVDKTEGRFLVPDFPLVRASVEQHAVLALRYLRAIPLAQRDYRLFCAWSLFLGLASLKWIDQSWQTKKFKKIPRLEALSVFNRIEQKIDSDAEIRAEFDRYLPGVTVEGSGVPSGGTLQPDTRHWLTKIYSGQLSAHSLRQLKLIDDVTNLRHDGKVLV